MAVIERPHRLIVLLAALQAFGPLSIDMYLPGLPQIAQEMGSSEASVQMTISAFLIGLFIGMLFYGPLSDKFGRRGLLLGGISLYTLASLGCVFATSIEHLVALRFAQALGGAAASVLGRTIVRDLFPVEESARVLSLMHLVTMIATLMAPLFGGYMLLLSGWRALFIVLMIFAATTLLFVAWKIPETHRGESRNSSVLAVFAAYFRIARHHHAIGYILCMSLTFAGMFAFITASPFVYINYFGIEPTHYAWLFSLNIGGVILFVTLNARFVKRVGTQPLLLAGASLAAGSGVLLLLCGLTSVGGLVPVVVGVFGFVGVTGLLGANCMASLLARYPQQAGAAAGLAVSAQFGLGALASSLAGSLHDGTPLPMTLIMGVCGVGSLAALMLTRQRN
ncbi:Bcr/CflA family drug resistance efflux transporter [Marinobacterium zhoushanense]|uniref:Bcr/CflA family efflux transporter n=1 Tax=Marinobacterium zhoushanense TaxID=1679163 RepID=A0ABQ1KSQ6_9GAMM|nr:Bcr/CflA family multidrug efflux MFS transporter [Marinobacterium zhoushanense]GGC06335.1 Bcr/CflA family drug resistance efflux transporter [Marinobacterium zhoushanense]